jgi:uncharacterized zinc-type alcohol dehydrogenase-like protein
MGAHVLAFTTAPAKIDAADMVSTTYPMMPMIQALKPGATLCSLGIPDTFDVAPIMLTMAQRRLVSSSAAGMVDTNDMLAFCREQGLVADVEIIRMDQINEALARLAKGAVHYRFVIDMQKPPRSPLQRNHAPRISCSC